MIIASTTPVKANSKKITIARKSSRLNSNAAGKCSATNISQSAEKANGSILPA